MGKIRLTLACWDYDRTRALQDGRVEVEGVDLTYLPLRVEETFWRMLRYGEFDVAEMSTGSFLMSRDKGAPRLIGPALLIAELWWRQGLGTQTPRVLIAMTASGYLTPAVSGCLAVCAAAACQLGALVPARYAPAHPWTPTTRPPGRLPATVRRP